MPITLYGVPISLYTGRARSYLIKAGLAYEEKTHTSKHFFDNVLPKAGGRRSMPTIEFEDGRVIRDSVAIVDHFEADRGNPHTPTTPRQRIVSRLIDAIASEGLLRPAMHYRWNFPEQDGYIRFHFRAMTPYHAPPEMRGDARADVMRNEATPNLGVTPRTIPKVESLYFDVLLALDAHFSEHPYLLGGRPCVGDFGLIGPMYGHLSRDPAPRDIMQRHALRVARWVERMNRPDRDAGEFPDSEDAFLGDDEIPETLIAVLRQLARDYVPETRAVANCVNSWLQTNAVAPGAVCERNTGGKAVFEVEGITFEAAAQPFRFYVLKRVQDEYDALTGANRDSVDALLTRCNLRDVLDIRLTRDIGRANNLEVWT